MSTDHTTPDDIAALLTTDPRPDLAWLDRLHRLGCHLAESCGPCWEAVRSLTPETAAWTLTPEPLIAALRRLYTPGSWPGLSADHFEVARTADGHPLGFALLVVEEAWRLSQSGHWWITEPLAAARYLLDQLEGDHRGEPVIADLRARIAAYQARIHLNRGELLVARATVGEMAGHLAQGSHDPRGEATCFETRGQVALGSRFLWSARDFFTRGLRALGREHPLRRFELRLEIADTLVREKPWRGPLGALRQWRLSRALPREVAAMLAELDRAALADDPAVRAWTLYRKASAAVRLLQSAARAGTRADRLDLPDVVAELESEEKVFSATVDRAVRGRALLYLAQLHELTRPPEVAAEPAERAYRSALEIFDQSGADHLFMKACQGLSALYNRTDRRDQLRQLDELLEARADRSLPGVRERLDEPHS